MGNGNIEVGNTTATRKPGQPIVECLPGSDVASRQTGKTRQGISGAMTQQGDEGGPSNLSVPQKLVHLVGCPAAVGPAKALSKHCFVQIIE